MMTVTTLMLLLSAQASLGISANVVRPAEISPAARRDGAQIVSIRFIEGVDVRAVGAVLERPGGDLVVARANGPGTATITLTY